MSTVSLNLWCAHPDDLLDEEAKNTCLRLLNEHECARWPAFKFEEHRREYLATHALARTALSYHGALAPGVWRFQENAFGKPAVDPECGLRFNLSNSSGLVACLVSNGADVGVDVEARERAGSIAEVGTRMFSAQELAQLEALSVSERPERALRLWTLKEAYSKARGMGLALPLKDFSFVFEDAERMHLEMEPTLDDSPGRWRFCLLEHAGHSIAMVVECTGVPELCVWEARPPSAAPRRLTLAPVRWSPETCSTSPCY